MVKKGCLKFPCEKSLIGLDAEWTKNYKIKNGNVPFCFSAVSIKWDDLSYEHLINGTLDFSFIQFYCENNMESKELIQHFDSIAGEIVNSLSTCVVCGHQLSSDISVFLNYAKFIDLPQLNSVEKMHSLWLKRRSADNICVFDTRYDIDQDFLGTSRRLVDVSNDFCLDVTQPELGNKSMTKLHNQYLANGDNSIRDRISVMNIRHSLCAVVLYWINNQVSKGSTLQCININKTINKNLQRYFNWIDNIKFKQLIK